MAKIRHNIGELVSGKIGSLKKIKLSGGSVISIGEALSSFG